MEISDKLVDQVRILYIDGNIILEETTQLKEYVEQYIEDPDLKGIVINCEKINYIDSSGLGLIVSIFKTLKKSEKHLALSCLSEKTMEIFILTKLDEIIMITPNDDQALASF